MQKALHKLGKLSKKKKNRVLLLKTSKICVHNAQPVLDVFKEILTCDKSHDFALVRNFEY